MDLRRPGAPRGQDRTGRYRSLGSCPTPPKVQHAPQGLGTKALTRRSRRRTERLATALSSPLPGSSLSTCNDTNRPCSERVPHGPHARDPTAETSCARYSRSCSPAGNTPAESRLC